MTALATPILIGAHDRPLFGWVNQPENLLSRATVIICPPLVREYFSVHNTYRVLAESLADNGITAIRFDYDGTGDSAGLDSDPDRIASYLDSIGHAVKLAQQLGGGDIALVGIRMGALLASLAAQRYERVAAMVLWDPCTSGRDFFREQNALFRMQFGKSDLGEGRTEVPGFVLTEQTAQELSSLTPPALLDQVERALVLNRPDRPSDATFGIPLDRIEFETTEGQVELMDVEPFRSEVPPTTARVARWLETVLTAQPTLQNAPETRSSFTFTNQAGVTVSERFVQLGPHNLFGISTEPTTNAAGPLVLFLNSGIDPHVGPNRMWVELTREWAGLGLRCIRFDLSGIGDSPVRDDQAPFVVRLPEAFNDVAEVVDALQESTTAPPAPVVLVGLCSGAYQALESGLELRPRAVIAINPILRFEAPETKTGKLDARRRFCRPSGNLRSAYRALPSWWVVRWARRCYLAVARLRTKDQQSATHWMRRMSEQGTDVFCVCGDEEAEAFFQGAMPQSPRIELAKQARIEVISGLDHALIPAGQRASVARLVTEHLHALGIVAGSVAGGDRGSDPQSPLPTT
jgi:alpha-beta hydrolase superfamily lysophospholipase